MERAADRATRYLPANRIEQRKQRLWSEGYTCKGNRPHSSWVDGMFVDEFLNTLRREVIVCQRPAELGVDWRIGMGVFKFVYRAAEINPFSLDRVELLRENRAHESTLRASLKRQDEGRFPDDDLPRRVDDARNKAEDEADGKKCRGKDERCQQSVGELIDARSHSIIFCRSSAGSLSPSARSLD